MSKTVLAGNNLFNASDSTGLNIGMTQSTTPASPAALSALTTTKASGASDSSNANFLQGRAKPADDTIAKPSFLGKIFAFIGALFECINCGIPPSSVFARMDAIIEAEDQRQRKKDNETTVRYFIENLEYLHEKEVPKNYLVTFAWERLRIACRNELSNDECCKTAWTKMNKGLTTVFGNKDKVNILGELLKLNNPYSAAAIDLDHYFPSDKRLLVEAYKLYFSEKVAARKDGPNKNDMDEIRLAQQYSLSFRAAELIKARSALRGTREFAAWTKVQNKWKSYGYTETEMKNLEHLLDAKANLDVVANFQANFVERDDMNADAKSKIRDNCLFLTTVHEIYTKELKSTPRVTYVSPGNPSQDQVSDASSGLGSDDD